MRVLLGYLSQWIAPGEDFMSFLPAGLPILAAVLEREGHEVMLANYSGMTPKQALRHVREFSPGAAGFSLFTHNRFETFELAGLIRRALPDCRIFVGGPHASPLGDEILKREASIDWVIRGEGEGILPDLVRLVEVNPVRKDRKMIPGQAPAPTDAAMESLLANQLPPRATLSAATRITDLDSLPQGCLYGGKTFGLDPRIQYSLIIGSRGCAWACAFCASPTLWGRRVSSRSARSIVDEIRQARDRFGIQYFHIRDDNFTLNKERVLEFASLLQREGPAVRFNCQARVDSVDDEILEALAESGLEHIQFGVESGSPATLERFAKDVSPDAVIRACRSARKAGIPASVYLIGAIPGETREDIRATNELLSKAGPNDAVVSPLAIFPGTELCRQATDDGDMNDSLWFRSREPAIFAAIGDHAAIARLEELSSLAGRFTPPAPEIPPSLEGLSGMRLLSFGEQSAALGMDEQAGRLFAAAMERAPENPWCLYRLAEWHLDQGNPAEATRIAQALTALVPRWEDAASLLEAALAAANPKKKRNNRQN